METKIILIKVFFFLLAKKQKKLYFDNSISKNKYNLSQYDTLLFL